MRENLWFHITSRLRDGCILAGGVILIAAAAAGCGERENILAIEKPTDVRSIEQSPSSPGSASTGVEPGKVVATLKPGETARVVGVYHGQDHDGFKVKLGDGTEGLILAGDTFRVTTR
ncbi:MAG: hypothetical protein CV088_19580 [Nitrospira sp. LK70]|nr:hypothetical protein [Nitrospira sp. LK70]